MLTILNRWIPPRIHQKHGRRLGQIQSNTASFQADQEHCNVDVVHCRAISICRPYTVLSATPTEILNRSVARLGAHCSLEPTKLGYVSR